MVNGYFPGTARCTEYVNVDVPQRTVVRLHETGCGWVVMQSGVLPAVPAAADPCPLMDNTEAASAAFNLGADDPSVCGFTP
mmetsp:Transcript_69245/g.158979  ORF Transcript_69245/g.158979 Transcript_69245/m.158979 type:complete len:81 (-) Transcript_69245:186-428(-)